VLVVLHGEFVFILVLYVVLSSGVSKHLSQHVPKQLSLKRGSFSIVLPSAEDMNQGFALTRAQVRVRADGRVERHIPVGDLILQTELRVATALDVHAFRCPCRNCQGGHRKTIDVIQRHHVDVGRDPFLMHSMIGRDPADGYPPRGLWVEDIAYNDDIIEQRSVGGPDMQEATSEDEAEPEVENDAVTDQPLDEFHEVQRQVMEALDQGYAFHLEIGEEPDVADDDKIEDDTVDELEDLYDQATTPLYTGSKTSVVSV